MRRRSARVRVEFVFQGRYPFRHRLFEALQPLALAQRATAGAGAHLGPVDRQLLQADQPFSDQSGHALAQQAIQQRPVLAPKLSQEVMIDRRPAAQPAISRVLLTQTVDRPRRADPLQRRIEPNRQNHLRISRRTPGNRVARLDPVVKLTQIQTFDKRPNQPRPVIVRQLTVQIDHVPAQLRPVGTNHPYAVGHPNPPSPPLIGLYNSDGANPSGQRRFRDWITASQAGTHVGHGHRPSPLWTIGLPRDYARAVEVP